MIVENALRPHSVTCRPTVSLEVPRIVAADTREEEGLSSVNCV